MHPNTVVAALTTTQSTILVVAVLVLVAIALWVLFSWRPRHRARQAETAAQMFREDHLGEWARKRLSTWTTDERHAALRYYTRVGFQARSGAIRTDMVPNNHHATIVALAAQETDGGTSQTKWGEVEWLGRNLAKRRDDLSIKWTPTAKATPEPEAAGKVSVAPDLAGDAESDSLNLAAAMEQATTARDSATESVSTLDQSATEAAATGIDEDSFDDANGEVLGSPPDPTASNDLATAGALGADETITDHEIVGPGDHDAVEDDAADGNTVDDEVLAASEEQDVDADADEVPDSAQNDDEDQPGTDPSGVSGQGTDESTSDSTDAEDVDGAVAAAMSFDGLTSSDETAAEAETAVDPTATKIQAESLAGALARAEVAPDIGAAPKSFDTSETQVSETPDPEIEAAISESTLSEGTTGQSSDDDQTTDRANVPTWILDARAALDSLDADATSVNAEDEADSLDAIETEGNENDNELVALETDLEADDLAGDEVALADLDDVEVAYLAASTATAATEADVELRVRMQRLRRRAKRQMRKSADDRAVAVRRAEQGRKKKAREYTKRAAAHETRAKKFKARRRKLRDIRSGTYKG